MGDFTISFLLIYMYIYKQWCEIYFTLDRLSVKQLQQLLFMEVHIKVQYYKWNFYRIHAVLLTFVWFSAVKPECDL